MAKSVWFAATDFEAFKEGKEVTRQGKPRVAQKVYATYNERAAFNDGWDSWSKPRRLTSV